MLILLPFFLQHYFTVVPYIYNNIDKLNVSEMLTYDIVIILLFSAVVSHIITTKCLKMLIFQWNELFPFLKF
jgi:hypothetical protein